MGAEACIPLAQLQQTESKPSGHSLPVQRAQEGSARSPLQSSQGEEKDETALEQKHVRSVS